MAARKSKAKVEAAIKTLALAYPGAVEDHPWGETAIKIKGKVFLFMGQPAQGGIGFSVKLPVSGAEALQLPFASPTGYGLGKHGWVTAAFPPGEDVPLDLVREWIDESFRAVAPKAVLAQLEVREAAGTKVARKADSKAEKRV